MGASVTFLDAGRVHECKSNPAYPDGMQVDMRQHVLEKACCFNLPYPAPRVGSYVVDCDQCGVRVALTVAGRPDDPRTVTIPCKPQGNA